MSFALIYSIDPQATFSPLGNTLKFHDFMRRRMNGDFSVTHYAEGEANYLKRNANVRQRVWRERQSREGLVQVRCWVPDECANELRAVGAAMRTAGISRPSTPKQRYEVQRTIKERGMSEPPSDVFKDRRRLEVWLALHGRNRAKVP